MTNHNLLHDIPAGPSVPDEVNVIIEVPAGEQNKYEYDKDNAIFALDRVLYSPMHYPGNYGFIPQTHADDGDPMDGLVLVTNPVPQGVLVVSRPIGVMRMIDQGEGDDKILAVAVDDPRYAEYKDLSDVPPHVLKEIEHFFSVYKHLENKEVSVKGWGNAEEARKVVQDSVEAYKAK